MSNAVSGQSHGDRGISPPGPRPDYKTYRSPYAPKYTIAQHAHGINSIKLGRFGASMGAFAVAAGMAGVFFISDVPRFRIDVMQKLPIVGGYFVKEIPPEDNPF